MAQKKEDTTTETERQYCDLSTEKAGIHGLPFLDSQKALISTLDEEERVVCLCHTEEDAALLGGNKHYSCYAEDMDRRMNARMTDLRHTFRRIVYVPDAAHLASATAVAREHRDVYVVVMAEGLTAAASRETNVKEYLATVINHAYRCKFWAMYRSHDGFRCRVSNSDLGYFCNLQGVYRYKERSNPDVSYVQVSGNVINRIDPDDVRRLALQYIWRSDSKEAYDAATNSNFLKLTAFETVPTYEQFHARPLLTKRYDKDSQTFFFENDTCVRVSPDGYSLVEKPDTKTWSDTLIPIAFEKTQDSFVMRDGELVHDLSRRYVSPLERVIINTSRVNWRVEMEARVTGNEEEDKKYFETNRFTLRGPRLTAEEQDEQERNFRAKCYVIGYLLHRHKESGSQWGVWCMEESTKGNKISQGGTGKSFLLRTIEEYKFCVVKSFDGRKKSRNDKFLFQGVTSNTDLMFLDDCERNTKISDYYNEITGTMTVEPKGKPSFDLPFSVSPKLVFASNYSPKAATDSSTTRRILYMVYSDWYHTKTMDNDYRESHEIKDDFAEEFDGGVICSLDRYSQQASVADANFLLSCLHFYLYYHCTRKTVLVPPMEKVNRRINESSYGDAFEEWATSYFDETNGDNFNIKIRQDSMYDDFINSQFLNKTSYSMISFTKSLRAYCRAKGYEINPQDEPSVNVREDGRIIDRVPMGLVDGGKLRTWFYVRNKNVSQKKVYATQPNKENEAPIF